MRVLGNLFVKFLLPSALSRRQEFKKTVNAKPQFMNRFLYEWEAYYNDLAHDKHVTSLSDWTNTQIGKDLTKEEKDMLNDSQKEQFQSLEQEAKHLFDKEQKDWFSVV